MSTAREKRQAAAKRQTCRTLMCEDVNIKERKDYLRFAKKYHPDKIAERLQKGPPLTPKEEKKASLFKDVTQCHNLKCYCDNCPEPQEEKLQEQKQVSPIIVPSTLNLLFDTNLKNWIEQVEEWFEQIIPIFTWFLQLTKRLDNLRIQNTIQSLINQVKERKSILQQWLIYYPGTPEEMKGWLEKSLVSNTDNDKITGGWHKWLQTWNDLVFLIEEEIRTESKEIRVGDFRSLYNPLTQFIDEGQRKHNIETLHFELEHFRFLIYIQQWIYQAYALEWGCSFTTSFSLFPEVRNLTKTTFVSLVRPLLSKFHVPIPVSMETLWNQGCTRIKNTHAKSQHLDDIYNLQQAILTSGNCLQGTVPQGTIPNGTIFNQYPLPFDWKNRYQARKKLLLDIIQSIEPSKFQEVKSLLLFNDKRLLNYNVYDSVPTFVQAAQLLVDELKNDHLRQLDSILIHLIMERLTKLSTLLDNQQFYNISNSQPNQNKLNESTYVLRQLQWLTHAYSEFWDCDHLSNPLSSLEWISGWISSALTQTSEQTLIQNFYQTLRNHCSIVNCILHKLIPIDSAILTIL